MTFEPTFRNQFKDPTTGPFLDARNCSYQAGAMLLDWQTLGRIRVWGGVLFDRANDDDPENGGNLWDIQRAWRSFGEADHYDIRTFKADGTWAGAVAYLEAGYALETGGRYEQIPANDRCQQNANIGHAYIILPESKPSASGRQWKVGDPLCQDFNFIPEPDLKDYTEALGRQHGITTTSGKPGIFYARATRKEVPDTATHRVRVTQGPFQDYQLDSQGRVTGRTIRFTDGFSAACEDWSSHPWPAKGKDVWAVKVLSGFLKGHHIGGAGDNFYGP